jgi:hypothetical protein
MTGHAATRLEKAVADWLATKTSVPIYTATQTDNKTLPCVVVRAGNVSQPGFPDNFFEASLEVALATAAPQTSLSLHRDMEDSIGRELADYLTAIAEVGGGAGLSGFRLATVTTEYEENRTATIWTVEVDFYLVDTT